MNTEIKQIAERIRGLRDALDVSLAEAAQKCEISEAVLSRYETGEVDLPMSFICRFAQEFGVETSTIISGIEPKVSSFYVTRKGTGVSVERTKAYKYRSLFHGFQKAHMSPFEVTVEPNDAPITLNTHPGQEFNMILEGTMQISIANHDIILNEGDSIYFDATKPHGMKALNGKKVRFLAVIE
jgi:transcriptional regulator with XRE-family HTH domain